MAARHDPDESTVKNFLKGLSFSQLLAGALAAVTSFLLSSKIGIAGSVIGVAVASIVSTAASRIYQNVIDASSKKLQNAAAQQLGEAPADGKDQDADTQTIPPVGASGNGRGRKARVVASDGAAVDAGSATNAGNGRKSGNGRVPLTKHDKRVAIVVAAVSGLIAVAVTAGVILALTGGKGTDSVVHDIINPSMTSDDGGEMSPSPSQSVITPSMDATSTSEPSSAAGTSTPKSGAHQDTNTNGGGSDGNVTDPSASPSAGQDAGGNTDDANGSGETGAGGSGQDGTGQSSDGQQNKDADTNDD